MRGATFTIAPLSEATHSTDPSRDNGAMVNVAPSRSTLSYPLGEPAEKIRACALGGRSYQVGEDAMSSSAAATLSGRENQNPCPCGHCIFLK